MLFSPMLMLLLLAATTFCFHVTGIYLQISPQVGPGMRGFPKKKFGDADLRFFPGWIPFPSPKHHHHHHHHHHHGNLIGRKLTMLTGANSLSLRFNGHFPGEPWLAGVY